MDSLHDPAELKVRLQHERFTTDAGFEMLDELRALGSDAAPLIPLVVSRLSADTLPCSVSHIIGLYVSTRNPDLLAYIRSPRFWPSLNIPDRSQLFSAGVPDIEHELLDYLWVHFADPADYNRRLIIQALATSGSPAALEILRLIDSRLSSELPERAMAAPPEEEVQTVADHLSRVELAAQIGFLQAVRDATRNIQNRNA